MAGGRELAQQRAQGAQGGQVAQASDTGTVRGLFEQMRPEIQRALPRHMDADRMVRVALTVVQQNPQLEQCDPRTLLGALMTCTQVGLEPGPQGHVYLVPYGRKVTFIMGYQGMVELARRSGLLLSIAAHTIYANEVAGTNGGSFSVSYGTENNLHNTPIGFGERGEAVGYYAAAKIKSPAGNATEDVFVVLTRAEVDAFRARSATQKPDRPSGPWATDYEAMAWKGLALDTPIPTPAGWSTMGALSAGDEVFDMDGERTRIEAVSQVKNIDCYQVTFANGESVVCDGEHEWLAKIGRNAARGPWAKVNITNLYDAKQAGQPIVMPVAGPLDVEPVDLPVDPWALGYWLGNGARGRGQVTVNRDDTTHVVAQLTAAGLEVGSVRPDPRAYCDSVGIRGGFAKMLAELGVLEHKHVPPAYLRASTSQRLALLRGLIDSDGHIDKGRHRVTFTSCDRVLADAVAELARSLGEMVHTNTVQRTGYGHTVASHEVHWRPVFVPASTPRRVARFEARQVAPYRSVKSIEKIPTVPTVCIAVDSPSHTFLAGRDMVPTHNTTIRRLARWLPQSPELAAALDREETVRDDVRTNVVDSAQQVPAEPFEPPAALPVSEPSAVPSAVPQDAAPPEDPWAGPGGTVPGEPGDPWTTS